MASQTTQPSKKAKLDERSPVGTSENQVTDRNSTETTSNYWPRFLVIEDAQASEKTLASLSPFVIERAMKCYSSAVQNVKKLRSGALLVEATREAQANNLLKMTEFASVPVKVSAHRTLNTTKGVIRSLELSKLSSDELLHELQSQGVVAVQNIFQTREGQKRKTATIILTFCNSSLPPNIRAGYEQLRVETYIPNPLRCFKCQQFGHGQQTCSKKPICAKCGLEAHGDNECSRTVQCVNCKGDHPSFAPSCPTWKKEKEICRVKAVNGVSFADARKLVSTVAQTPAPGVSYSNAVTMRKEMKTVATQTCVTHCKCLPTVDISETTQSKSISTMTVESNTTSSKVDKPVQARQAASAQAKQATSAQARQGTSAQARQSAPAQEKTHNPEHSRTQSLSPTSREYQTVLDKRKIKTQTNRSRKGSEDPIKQFNRYQSFEGMEGDFSDDELKGEKPPFKPNQIKPPS